MHFHIWIYVLVSVLIRVAAQLRNMNNWTFIKIIRTSVLFNIQASRGFRYFIYCSRWRPTMNFNGNTSTVRLRCRAADVAPHAASTTKQKSMRTQLRTRPPDALSTFTAGQWMRTESAVIRRATIVTQHSNSGCSQYQRIRETNKSRNENEILETIKRNPE